MKKTAIVYPGAEQPRAELGLDTGLKGAERVEEYLDTKIPEQTKAQTYLQGLVEVSQVVDERSCFAICTTVRESGFS